ncbi:VanZ family protein [Planctomicrobium sp. SH668]|uniref:VanZ family protein n=1 Tax=Planctomicrobium sp. SH668 TaxID=3448126 RepID=UPI003F5B3849
MSPKIVFAIRVIAVLCTLTLFIATHIPVPLLIEDVVSLFDKAIHAGAFFVFATLVILAFCLGPKPQTPSYRLLFGLLGYAALDEYLQGFVNRVPDLNDWIADAVGITVSFFLTSFLLRRLQFKLTESEAAIGSQQPLEQ